MQHQLTRRSAVKGMGTAMVGAAIGAGLFGSSAHASESVDGFVVSNTGGNGVVTMRNDATEEYQAIYDVLVLGAGCAGMAAAYEAAVAGAKVGLVEARANYYESNSSVSHGQVWGWNTDVQRRCGVPEQSREACAAYLTAVAGGGKPIQEIVDVFIDRADDTFAWYQGLGVEFDDDGLVQNGAEYLVEYGYDPIPHTHHNITRTGRGLTDALYNACTEAGVEFIFNTLATALITDPDGRVVGAVTAKGNFRGNQGVVVATSGFSRNQQLVDAFSPHLTGSVAGPYSHGDGIIMGAAVGAKLTHLWCMQAPSIGTLMPGDLYLDNLIATLNLPDIEVGLDGKRHYSEDLYYEDKYETVNDLDGQMIWCIWDQATTDLGPEITFTPPNSDNFDAEVEGGYVFRADTIEEIAELCGLDPAVLVETVNRYNEMAQAGLDEDFGRTLNFTPLVTPPYYACPGIGATPDTGGGLVINKNAEVLNWNDEVIPGFFAAGTTTGGWRGDYYPGCGTAISISTIFGRIAGQNAAANEPGSYEGKLASDAGSYLDADVQEEVELGENEYLGESMGMGGELRVKVTVVDGVITDIEVVAENETDGIGSRAVEQLPSLILEAQSVDVDGITGATVSSDAIKSAVSQALEQAGL